MEFKKLVAHCKEYAFVYPSSEIYDGLSASYDYGPNGIELKNNLKNYWWQSMVIMHENIVGLDSAIFMHPKTWKASGHVDAFNDPMIDNKNSKKRYRADQLIESYCEKIENKIIKDIEKARNRFGDDFDEIKYRNTNTRIVERQKKIDTVLKRMNNALKSNDMKDLYDLIVELEISCPDSGSRNWTEVRQFNLMFYTQLGNIEGSDEKLYLRPETAQGIFVNFLNVQKTTRKKLPFGIAQIGKAFRNEIIARQFIFRMREFEQMEMQFFVKPGTEIQWYQYWKENRLKWHQNIGLPTSKLRYHDHDKLAHYANAAVDIEYHFPFGFRELEGIHSRTNFDLKQHEHYSGKKLQYFDPHENKSYVPYVVETSLGCDRMFLAVLANAYNEEIIPDSTDKENNRIVMNFHPALAPIKLAILPLLKNKVELTERARNIFNDLKKHFLCHYDDKDAIGRRYRRQDAIGTPYCMTIDFESLESNSVTLRERDTMVQKRIAVAEVIKLVKKNISISSLF